MTGIAILLVYVMAFVLAAALAGLLRRGRIRRADFSSLKTVTFGDESAIRSDRLASIASVVVIFLLWGAFTGSRLVPLHVPGPFAGETSFTYQSENEGGQLSDGRVRIAVGPDGALPAGAETSEDVAVAVQSGRNKLIQLPDDARAVSVNGTSGGYRK